MSDLNQINTALERLFDGEGQRIVFWNDPEQEFQNTLPFVLLEGVTTLRLDQVGLSNLVRIFVTAGPEAGSDFNLDNPPAVFGQIEKFDLDVPFWQMVKATFGYGDENPTLKNFLLRLMLTDYAHHLKGDVPQ